MRRPLLIFSLFFILSGFTGLIYESIWTRYLKLFLGHAAYAQSLVLIIFMGGMAIGSWICGRYSGRFRNLLALYGITEGLIGIAALCYHEVFDLTVTFARAQIIPEAGSPVVIALCKWFIAAATILPQSILLGMTFPLISAGLLRMFPLQPGRSLSLLYFANSLGASVGILVSGFFLVRTVGLPGTIQVAGVLNLILAAAALLVARRFPEKEVAGEMREPKKEGQGGEGYRLLFAASLVTGGASFIYEIGWIRMLSQVLGSSTHSFELMLSAFILGLALGGWCIRNYIDKLENPLRFLAFIQILMGCLAVSTLNLYDFTFDIMGWLVSGLSKGEAGYNVFLLVSHAIAMGVMLPATFCAGMTLPLIITIAMKQGAGESVIGKVYCANTVGAIAGIFFAVNVGLPLLGVKNMIVFGAALDMGLGLILWCCATREKLRVAVPYAILGTCMLLGIVLFVEFDTYNMASGVFRDGLVFDKKYDKILYHKDGKTATVSVAVENGQFISLRTNGKSDAGFFLNTDMVSQDEPTMVMAAALPMALHPQARKVANIGLGSGLTTHTLLLNPLIRRVDTVEIEKEMVKAAALLRPRNELVFTDPRSKIHIEDAKTFFSLQDNKYDIIVSEPSNPWVSGVANLFTDEFYRSITGHLAEGGLFVQWMQLYEINSTLVTSVLKALSNNFDDYAIYFPNDKYAGDILIVATETGKIPEIKSLDCGNGDIKEALRRIGITSTASLEARRIATKRDLVDYLAKNPVRANSDYYPILGQNAARALFLDSSAEDFLLFLKSLRENAT